MTLTGKIARTGTILRTDYYYPSSYMVTSVETSVQETSRPGMGEAENRAGDRYDPILAARLSDFLKLSAVLLRSHNSKLIRELIATAVGDLMLTAVFSAFYQPNTTNQPLVAIANGKRLAGPDLNKLLAQLPRIEKRLDLNARINTVSFDAELQQELKARRLYLFSAQTPLQDYGLLIIGVNYEIDPTQTNFLVALADLAAIALENADRFDLLQQTVAENRLVNEIATALAGSLNPQELFEVFIQKLQPHLVFERASLTLLSPDQQYFGVLFTWSNVIGRVRRAHVAQIQVAGSLLETAIEHQEIVAEVAYKPSLEASVDPVFGEEIKSRLIVPLVNKNRIVGTLNLGTQRMEAYQDFTRLPVALLEKLVAHLALALSNSLLYEEQQISAETDSRLGVYNHDYFDRQIELQLNKASLHSHRLGLLMIDMDNLKTVNDTYGHQAGDAALRHLAHIITQSVRSSDLVARYGGDEFSVLLAGCTPKGLAVVSEKIRRDIRSSPLSLNNHEIHLTVSIGGALYPDDANSAPDLLNKADAAMYVAKKKRDQVRLGAKARLVRLTKIERANNPDVELTPNSEEN